MIASDLQSIIDAWQRKRGYPPAYIAVDREEFDALVQHMRLTGLEVPSDEPEFVMYMGVEVFPRKEPRL